MDRREVITKCMEMGVPIFQGRIDKTLFLASLRQASRSSSPGRTRPRSSRRRRAARPHLGGVRSRPRLEDPSVRIRCVPGRASTRSLDEGAEEELMEAQAVTAAAAATGSQDACRPLPLAVEKHAGTAGPALQGHEHRQLGRRLLRASWARSSRSSRSAFRTSASSASDKVGILSNTRPEWTYSDFAILCAGATVVPIYQTNSPEECQYVLRPLRGEGRDPRGRRSSSRRSARSATSFRTSST